jgi:hypothetical protein
MWCTVPSAGTHARVASAGEHCKKLRVAFFDVHGNHRTRQKSHDKHAAIGQARSRLKCTVNDNTVSHPNTWMTDLNDGRYNRRRNAFTISSAEDFTGLSVYPVLPHSP